MKLKAILIILLPVLLIEAKTVEQIKKENRARIAAIKEQGRISRQKIRRKFYKFLTDLKKLDRKASIALPIDEKNARNIIDHNTPPGDKELPRVYGYVKENYRLRTAASDRAIKTSTRVREGEKVEVVFMVRKRTTPVPWCLVKKKNGHEGFIPATHLHNTKDVTTTTTTTVTSKKGTYIVKVSSGLNMREDPATWGEKITTIPYRGKVKVLKYGKVQKIGKYTGKWAYVNYQGQKGWVFSAFLAKQKDIKVDNTTNNNVVSGKMFIMPVSGRISSKFGPRIDPITKKKKSYHRGIDIVARRGTPIKAAGDGKIHVAKYSRSYGNYHILDHGNNMYTYYAHQKKFRKRRGRVKKGEVIGYVGSTGRSTGPHLHFEVRKGRKAFNPKHYIPN